MSMTMKKKTLADKLRSVQEPSGEPHIIVIARAGTGKTTTLVEGLKYLQGQATDITPSDQQLAIWESMALSRGKVSSIAFCAFNKPIAVELQRRVPMGCDAMTNHSMGLKAVTAAYGRLKIQGYRTTNLLEIILESSIRDLRMKNPTIIRGVEKLVSLCKLNLTGFHDGELAAPNKECWIESLSELSAYYDVELNGSRDQVFDLVPQVLSRAMNPMDDGEIDFDDMVWLPVVRGLPVKQYDLLLVDEAQDLNRCQQALIRKAGRRLVLCGDPKQAIYGFAGADCDSMPRMEAELVAEARGCVILPLTVTRRCGKAIVMEARNQVPDFEAHEDNPLGLVGHALFKKKGAFNDYTAQVRDGDMILCRVNAPLVSQCFRFLKEGRKANIQGRDVGQGLIGTIKRLKAGSILDLVAKVDDWLHKEVDKENAKHNPSDARLIAFQDRADCIVCFTGGCDTVDQVVGKIESVFTDSLDTVGIKLSSIHKAKGLEAHRVFFLRPKGGECPHPMAKTGWQRGQEQNLLYVAITRAIEELVYVS